MYSFLSKTYTGILFFIFYSVLVLFSASGISAQTCSDLCPPATYPSHIYPLCAFSNPNPVECVLANPDFNCSDRLGDYCYCCRSNILITPTPTPAYDYCCNYSFKYCALPPTPVCIYTLDNCTSTSTSDDDYNCDSDETCIANVSFPRGYCATPTPTPIGWVPTSPPAVPTYAYPTTIIGVYTCFWDDVGGVCRTAQSCPSHCVETRPCLEMSELVCNDVRGDNLSCNCSQQLDLPSLYDEIQGGAGFFDFSSGASIGTIVSSLLRIIFPIAGLILLLMLIYGGYNYMLSGGEPKKAVAAKGIITMALVGFIIIFTAYWLVQIVGSILGLGAITTIF